MTPVQRPAADERESRSRIGALLSDSTFLRFCVAGVVNTVVGFASYGGAVLAGAPVGAALLCGIVAGIIFNFFSIGGYVFRMLILARLPRFVCGYLAIYAINYVALAALRRWLESPILAQLVLTLPMALLSYLIMQRFVFYRGQDDHG
jgi:putative flippase GtrA